MTQEEARKIAQEMRDRGVSAVAVGAHLNSTGERWLTGGYTADHTAWIVKAADSREVLADEAPTDPSEELHDRLGMAKDAVEKILREQGVVIHMGINGEVMFQDPNGGEDAWAELDEDLIVRSLKS
ncbi:hypothetical protein [Rhodococcus qingshengii]|uniref:hypothetical protein n=1 Tax=Rhodococcus qingshengii TaxID=334542 RepID=UPI0035DAFFAD